MDQAKLEALTDEELVDLFLAAQEQCDQRAADGYFEGILARYGWLVRHIARGGQFNRVRLNLPPWDSAEDVVARTAFKIYRGLRHWRREGKLASFIAKIASSELIDTVRRAKRDKSWQERAPESSDEDKAAPAENLPSPRPSPEAEAAVKEQRRIIDRLLADVCKDWKDSIVVREYIVEGLGAKDIADKYGVSEDLIYQRARRLKVRLMAWLRARGVKSADQLLAGSVGAARL